MNLSDPDLRRVLGAFVNVPSNNEGRIEAVLERMRQDFEATKGPLTPWSALNLAVDAGRPLPQWIIRHLRGVSKRIHESASQSMDKKLGREAEVMGRALGFGQGKAGATPAARESARMHRDFQVALRVVVQMMELGYSGPDQLPNGPVNAALHDHG